MKKFPILSVALLLLISATAVIGQNTRFSDPDTVIKSEFWGKLYAEGGQSFFCNTPFTSKGFLLTDGYIYPLADIRSALACGTSRQCEQDNRYRQIASDLHNMVPVRSRIEMQRRNTRYDDVGKVAKADECGIRVSTQFFEPPERVKGDVARTVAYMVSTYDLPWLGATSVFKGWNRLDPPDDTELTRHRRIVEIQGNENPFVNDPELLGQL